MRGKRNTNDDSPPAPTAEAETGTLPNNTSPPPAPPHSPHIVPAYIELIPPKDAIRPLTSLEVPAPINRDLSPVRSSGQHPPIGQSHRQLMSYVLQTRLSIGRLRRLLELYDIRVLSRPDNVLTQVRDFIGGRICETDWKGNVLENAVFEIVHTSLRVYLRRLG